MRQLLTTAAGQRGYFTAQQSRNNGLTRHDISGGLLRGEWVKVQPRVYRLGGVPDNWHGRLLAATLSGPHGTVASHSSAAGLIGLAAAADRSRIEVTVLSASVPRLHGVTVHRTVELPRQDVTLRDGIWTTGGARTVIDLAAPLDRHGRAALLDDAVGGGIAARRWISHRAGQLSGRPGTADLVALTHKGAEAEFRSWLERTSAGVFRAGGLPEAEWNVALREHGRLLGIVDVLWAWARLVVELDGLRFHSTPVQRREDAARANRIVLAGYRLLRYTWADVVHRAQQVVAEIALALSA